MKLASRVMYTIGLVFSIIAFVGAISLIVLGVKDLVAQNVQTGATYLALGIVYFIIYLVIIILAARARRQTGRKAKNHKGYHVLMLILGIIGFDVFYILGAIFGLIAD